MQGYIFCITMKKSNKNQKSNFEEDLKNILKTKVVVVVKISCENSTKINALNKILKENNIALITN